MYPTLLSIGTLDFHSYAVFLALAFLTAVLLIVRENYKLEKPYPITTIGGLWVFAGAMIGARVYYVIQYRGLDHLHEALILWGGGLVFYGGLFGGVLGAILYVKFCRVPILPMGDIAMPYVPLAHAIARVGCFLNGCCWGTVCDLPWAVQYSRKTYVYQKQLEEGLVQPGDLYTAAVHPTQLYSSASLLLLFFVMRYAYKHNERPGAVLMLYPLLYGIHRFTIEFFRGDVARPWLDFTASQVVAIGFVAFGLAGYAVLALTVWRKPPPSEEVPSALEEMT